MDMHRLDTAPFFPTACMCGNVTGPFVDTGMEKPVSGRVYVCERCVSDIACTNGQWVERKQYESTTAALGRSEAEVVRLTAELEAERSPAGKLLRVEEIPAVVKAIVIDLDKERAKRRPAPTKKASA